MKKIYVKEIAKILDEIDVIANVVTFADPNESIDEAGIPAIVFKTAKIRAILLTS